MLFWLNTHNSLSSVRWIVNLSIFYIDLNASYPLVFLSFLLFFRSSYIFSISLSLSLHRTTAITTILRRSVLLHLEWLMIHWKLKFPMIFKILIHFCVSSVLLQHSTPSAPIECRSAFRKYSTTRLKFSYSTWTHALSKKRMLDRRKKCSIEEKKSSIKENNIEIII